MKLFQLYTIFLFVFLSSIYTTTQAQGTGDQDPLEVKIFPPSPNTASLGKYGEVPVGLYTGIPQISIPLTTVQSGSLSMPISLSYHAGGIRVEEIASWVGLGWSLNAGGVITRQVRGIPDELDMDRQENIGNIKISEANNPNLARELMSDVVFGSRDTQSDLYVFNINGISGKFFLGNDNEVLFDKQQDLKVKRIDASSWIMTDGSGNKYYFGKSKDKSKAAIEIGENFSVNNLSSDGYSAITAWYITEIEDVTEQHKINFNYKTVPSISYYRSAEKEMLSVTNSDACSAPYLGYKRYFTASMVDQIILESITSQNQKINFITDVDREDLKDGFGRAAKALSKIIVVRNDNQSIIREYNLSYSYFPSLGVTNRYNQLNISDEQRYKKLRLNQVQEKNGNLIIPPHKFEYNSLPIPERFSCQMDFWGFYNGKDENDNRYNLKLIPTSDISFLPYSDLQVRYEGANRLPDEKYMKAGILEKIVYPTGGYTKFEYEANKTIDIIKFPKGYRNEYVFRRKRMEVIEDNLNTTTEQIFEINNASEPGQVIPKIPLEWRLENMHCEGDFATITCGIEIRIESISNPTFTPITLRNETGTVFLENGTYKMICIMDFDANPDIRKVDIIYNWEEGVSTQEKMAGGLRIKTVKSYNDEFATPIVKQYEYKSDNGLSSGRMPGRIMNSYFASVPSCPFVTTAVALSSGSYYPLVNTKGGYIGYQTVTVYDGLNKELGKSVNNYSFGSDVFLVGNYGAPFATISKEHVRGLLLSNKKYLSNTSNTYSLISETINDYSFANTIEIPNLVVTQVGTEAGGGTSMVLNKYGYVEYNTTSSWQRLYSTTQKTYDPNNSQLLKEQTTNYFYNEDARHTLPIRTETIVDGKKLSTHTKYPLDYAVLSTSNEVSKGIYYLQDKNVIGIPVETYTTESSEGEKDQEKVISAQMMVYNQDKPFLKEIHQLEANSAVADNPIENFVPSSINAQGEFVNDSRYEKRLEYFKYDEFGNPLEFGKTKDVHKSYIWGYKNTYPIAEVINASQDQIFHTSFEEGGTSQEARTGKRSFRIQSIYSMKEDLPSGEYLFSVWVKGAGTLTVLDNSKTFDSPNEWLRIEFKLSIDNNTDINIVGDDFLIDEIRLHPLEAHMITRTYTPLIGVSSETNVNHNSNFYEYDALQRLHIIRDKEGNIIKRTDYEYKGN
ncbi:hypothetical protein WAF17_06070 [Bernardetia sp. ABR2-2B]|uniref:hypothetical protein n=1 Tax=Bernardetia sp. ABR2-2B TaxID=3127472 RepID=UPI0030D54A43